jgi:hypothetical protein
MLYCKACVQKIEINPSALIARVYFNELGII